MKRLASITLFFLMICNASLSFGGQTIKVASVFSKTGTAALDNLSAMKGVRFAVEEINRNGGVLGRQMELIEFDNKSTALGSKISAKKAVESGVVTVFGANYSNHSLAMASILQEAGIPMISPYSTHPAVTLTGNYIFRVCYTDSFQAAIIANFAFKDLEAKTAGVLVNANRTYCEGLADSFAEHFSKLGGRVVFTSNYLDQTADFIPLIEKIKILHPDVVFLPGYIKDSGFIIKQARHEGVTTPFVGADGWNNSMYETVGNVIEGNYFSNQWHPDGPGTKNREFVEKYKKRSESLNPGSALGEDCVFLFADAVTRAGSFEPAKIRDAIAATVNFQGVTGLISFDENGDPVKSAVILKFDKGTSVYVKTVSPQ